ncbi:hypothetical protein [Pseudonocardia spinosispora]|uniref:hypothetical protein n=1 Tax=Pseudonocardia spinosispora TaxID=103441 RepID=UPI00041836B4|nr:hypothetical protein [Pseudonocardia spinosispora]
MPRIRFLLPALLVCAVVPLAGCATASAPAPPQAQTSAPPRPGEVLLTGAVTRPGVLTREALAAMPSQTVSVTFGTDRGSEQHTEVGVPLATVIDQAGPVTTPGVKHDVLSTGVLVVGADGYRALVSYGEMSPGFGHAVVLLATTQDGRPLDRPRLVLPGDVKGGRYVSDIVRLEVIHPGG